MDTPTRRNALAGATGGILILKSSTAFGSQANSAVSVGLIGSGNRGTFDARIVVKDARARLTAVCDIDPARIDKIKTVIPEADKARPYRDYRELLGQADIDAVVIATPIYLHPEHFETAVKARKHIYCEKSAGADVAGVKRLLRAAHQADKSRHIQFGFQQRHSPEYLAAEKIIHSPQFGRLLYMRSYWLVGGGSLAKNVPPPDEDAKKKSWYPWKAYSGDIIVEQHCHGVDVLNWFSKSHPIKAVGSGGRVKPAETGDVLDHLDVTYEYPGSIRGHLSGVQLPGPYREVKEAFWGAEGHITVTRRYYEHLVERKPPVKVESKLEITIDAFDNFFNRVVSGQPHNEAFFAAESTFTSLLGRMAIYEHREVTWDEMMRSA